MSSIEVPLVLSSVDDKLIQASGRAHAFVSLDEPEARGIHMSRIFKSVQENLPKSLLSQRLLESCLDQFLEAHKGLSRNGSLQVDFNLMLERLSLKSEQSAWRSYPIIFRCERRGQESKFSVQVTVQYSSTCPASGALARQLIQEEFGKRFHANNLSFAEVQAWLGSPEGMIATPHAQRSYAQVKVGISKNAKLKESSHGEKTLMIAISLIDRIEEVLQTPVQALVKRVDEQEFALRNGRNLMFCEDAARRTQQILQADSMFESFAGEFRHVESLHPHDAVARIASLNLPC